MTFKFKQKAKVKSGFYEGCKVELLAPTEIFSHNERGRLGLRPVYISGYIVRILDKKYDGEITLPEDLLELI